MKLEVIFKGKCTADNSWVQGQYVNIGETDHYIYHWSETEMRFVLTEIYPESIELLKYVKEI